MLLPSGSRLNDPASSGGESSNSSFHICLQVDWKTSSVCLTTEERLLGWRERIRNKKWKGEERGGWVRRTKRGLTYFLDSGWIHFSSVVTAWHTQTLCPFSLLSSHLFPIPSLLSPLSSYFGTRLSFSKRSSCFCHVQWLCMLPSCGLQCYYTHLFKIECGHLVRSGLWIIIWGSHLLRFGSKCWLFWEIVHQVLWLVLRPTRPSKKKKEKKKKSLVHCMGQ